MSQLAGVHGPDGYKHDGYTTTYEECLISAWNYVINACKSYEKHR